MAGKVQIVGDGLKVDRSETHPAGIMYSGGYDSDKHTLFLASVVGHPRGVSLAGGDPSADGVAGLRILIVESGCIYWATDSMSLPRGLNKEESENVQTALETHFAGKLITRIEKLEDIPK